MKKRILAYLPIPVWSLEGTWPPTVSPTSYFHWQKELWHFFAGQDLVRVLWNSWPGDKSLVDPMREWKSDRIEYRSWRSDRVLDNCDLVFVDFPSTSILDCVKKGKGFVCITLWDHGWIRDDMKFVYKVQSYVEALACLELALSSHRQDVQWLQVNQADWLKEIAYK